MSFDITKRDVQATEIAPVSVSQFDVDAYVEYEAKLLERAAAFATASEGVAVYRRMRAAEVFSDGSCDMRRSLELQLGCLRKSMDFEADIPNFLEPWYGIGTTASAYGAEYVWFTGQAPAVHPRFDTVAEALACEPAPIAQTAIGRHTLDMVDYFLNATQGKLPMCFSDAQSPLNASTMIVNTNNLMMDVLFDPESVRLFLDRLADLNIDFVNEQKKLIGTCLVNPGHGFASARNFTGYGQSDDNILMLSNEQYIDCALPAFRKIGEAFGGAVFHSCGDWSAHIPAVCAIDGLRCIDAAFSPETDPDPNPCDPFVETFANSGIVVNARIVGGLDVIENRVRALWRRGMKLIVVTYCRTAEEQREAYQMIHDICQPKSITNYELRITSSPVSSISSISSISSNK